MNETVLPKRRGRPPGSKNKVRSSAQTSSEPLVKRGRGRPRKNLQNLLTESPGANTVSPVGAVKRGRGRPKGSRNGVKTVNGSPEPTRGYFKRVGRVVSSGVCTGMTLSVFDKVPHESMVGELTPRGSRVLVAKFPDFYKIYLKHFYDVGSKEYPKGCVEVYNANEGQSGYYYPDQVALHPEGGSRRMIVVTDDEGNETGEEMAVPVSLTKASERAERKLLRREKKLAKEKKRDLKKEMKMVKVQIKEIRKQMKKAKKVSEKKDLRQKIKQLKSLIENKKYELSECMKKISG